ncbi:hypothetical protein LF1_38790 [Rubripirellula obstinata]|uniref:Uncharacterized protein n=2 Tax=Rubripirellula obstinata TaxID=406547 RepID=A0A5B1CLX7_9BACT|nr:hypothetical protein LF1_38790 [Rubripirellula obstinata]
MFVLVFRYSVRDALVFSQQRTLGEGELGALGVPNKDLIAIVQRTAGMLVGGTPAWSNRNHLRRDLHIFAQAPSWPDENHFNAANWASNNLAVNTNWNAIKHCGNGTIA